MAQADSIARAAAALRGGDAAGAQALLAPICATATAPVQALWLLAQCFRAQDDLAGEITALDGILRQSRRDIAVLLAMADAQGRKQDLRAQLSFARAAISQAQATPPPAQLHPMLRAAEQTIATAQAALATEFETIIQRLGLDAAHASPALSHAIDLLYGRSEIYLQQPSMFYYPGLPQRCFYDAAEFGWARDFAAQTAAMKAELLAVLNDAEAFTPYIEHTPDRPASANHLLGKADWSAGYLWRNGALTALAERAPATIAALAAVDQPLITARSPMALWSRLKPGTHIEPHHGLLNTRLICHLPLIAPDGCALRVGHETRHWREGELLIFDDSIEHEAWNRGTADRTVLLFEIWRPEIPLADRPVLSALFAAIAAGGGGEGIDA